MTGAIVDQANGQLLTAGFAQSIGTDSNSARYCRFTFTGNKSRGGEAPFVGLTRWVLPT